jgi:hypothetical protein
MLSMPAVASAHTGVANSGIQMGELKKAVPNQAFLNAINKYKSTEGAMDQHVDTEPEDNAEDSDDEQADDRGGDDMDMGDEQVGDGEFDLFPNDDLEGKQVDEWDNN